MKTRTRERLNTVEPSITRRRIQYILRLGVEGSETKRFLTAMRGTQDMDTKAEDGLMASHFQGDEVIVPLPRTYVRQRTPADRDDFWPKKLQGWSHLQIISKKHVPPYMDGLNCSSAVRPRDIVCGNENEAYAVRSLLG